MIYCIHDEDPNACPVCVKAEKDDVGLVVEARFDSTCPRCWEPIERGEEIAHDDDGWVHVDCR